MHSSHVGGRTHSDPASLDNTMTNTPSRRFLAPLSALASIALFAVAAETSSALPARQNTVEVPITVTSPVERKQMVTLHRDHEDAFVYYYLPAVPQLVQVPAPPAGEGGKGAATMPQFLFQKYQLSTKDSATNKQLEGALLQFSVTLGYTAEQLKEMEAGVRAGAKIPEEQAITLRPVAIKNPRVVIYDPTTGQAAGGGTTGGLAPSSLTAEIPFSARLDVVSSTLNDRIVRGATGVPCWFSYEYDQVTEPAGFKVTVFWDNIASHFSSATDIQSQDREKFLWWDYAKSETNTSIRTVVDNYTNSGFIKVEGTTSEKLTADQLQVYLQPIIEKATAMLAGEAPAKVDPATVEPIDHELSGSGVQSNVNSGFKSVVDRRTGTQTFNFNFREVLSSPNQANGFIGIGAYLSRHPQLEAMLVPPTLGDSDDFAKASFALPTVVAPRAMGVSEITVSLTNTAGNDQKYLLVWRPDDVKAGGKGRWFSRGEPITFLDLGIGAFRSKLESEGKLAQWKELLTFPVETTVNCVVGMKGREQSFALVEKGVIPGFNGEAAELRPLDRVRIAEVHASLLGGLLTDKAKDSIRVAIEVPDGSGGSRVLEYEWRADSVEEPFMFPVRPEPDGSYRMKVSDLRIRSGGKSIRQDWFPSSGTPASHADLRNKLYIELDEDLLENDRWFTQL